MPRSVDIPSDHFLDDPPDVDRICRRRRGQFPVAQNGDIISDGEQLLHFMGDVNDRHAVGFEVGDDSKERFSLGGCQGRGWLVHDQDANIMGKRFRDFDDLLLANAKVSHQGGGVQRLFEAVQQFAGNLFLLPMLDDPSSGDFAADENILRDAEIREKLEFLENDPDPGARRLACRLEFDRNSVEENASRGWLGDASQNFHQGRLARSILANEDVNCTLMNGEIDLIEGECAWITLSDLFSENHDVVRV
jgi:hypothetical protein